MLAFGFFDLTNCRSGFELGLAKTVTWLWLCQTGTSRPTPTTILTQLFLFVEHLRSCICFSEEYYLSSYGYRKS